MSDDPNSSAPSESQEPSPAVSAAYSVQPTGLVETTFAETLGLSMHNAVVSQQSSQMTTAASITNACARLLQASKLPEPKPKKEDEPAPEEPPIKADTQDAPAPKRKFNIMNFMKPKATDDSAGGSPENATEADSSEGSNEQQKPS